MYQFKPAIRESVGQRFNKRVMRNNSCWEWTGPFSKGGYGQFAYTHADKRSAHRVAWELANGVIPDGLHVLHKCDNRKCVRPDHLFLGTAIDNIADMDAKGRRNSTARHKGETSPRSKLKNEDIKIIRELHSNGIKQNEIACKYNIHDSAISRIINKKRWGHI